jgi:hypothetical protein
MKLVFVYIIGFENIVVFVHLHLSGCTTYRGMMRTYVYQYITMVAAVGSTILVVVFYLVQNLENI